MYGQQGSFGRDFGLAVLASLVVATASLLGQISTYPNLAPWYANLAKPWFNPPDWIFGPVWTLLYVLMAFANWRILRLPPSSDRTRALSLFFGQLALNAAWSWMFFAAHSALLGLIDIIPQLALIIITAAAFYRIDRIAGLSLIPLAAWVGYAILLNFAIWRLNS
ncbi:MAG TPA: TspO/MBR family protein [Xanthobacteraceae bacterium]|jgi:tryptophan-rich sensory protein|nr:TspO/MBR family protein [Xanthobacteraceae bacterium]